VTRKGDEIRGQVCKDWVFGKVILYFTRLGISLVIVGFNYVLRRAIIELVRWIGKKTFSSQMNSILKFLFISQTLNTAIILMSVHANFENAHLPYIKQIFNGSYPDFTMEWYYKIGSIFSQTLVILGIMPAVDALFEFTLSRLK
jgi:hypothetical protein